MVSRFFPFMVKFALIVERAFTGDRLKIFMKTGEIIKAAFVTYLLYVDFIFNQQFTGMTYSYFINELRIGFSCSGFEIAAKVIDAYMSDLRHLGGLDLSLKVSERKFIYRVDSVIFCFFKIMLEAHRRKQFYLAAVSYRR
jgi:hypothetical protein